MLYGAPALVIRWDEPRRSTMRMMAHFGATAALRAELGLPAHTGDEQLVTAAFGRWGVDAPAHFVGPFAIAAVLPGSDELTLARDHVGQQPLYWAEIRGGLVVSVDLAAVLAHPEVPDDVDTELAACLYARAFRPLARRTPFRAVRKVAPGTVVTFARGRPREHRYWRPEALRVQARLSLADWAAQVGDLLPEVVRDAVPATGTVAAHLSGGLDSTAVATLTDFALSGSGRRLGAVYSWSPPPASLPLDGGDERGLVELTAARRQWPVTYVPLRVPDEQRTTGHPLLRHQDTWWRESWVARDARDQDISWIMSGWGGDEGISFNGRTAIPAMARRGHVLAATREIRRRRALLGVPASPPDLARALARSMLPPATMDVLRRLLARTGGTAPAADGYTRWIEAWKGYPLAFHELNESRAQAARAGSCQETQLLLLQRGHLGARCEAWSAAGASHGIGYRYPLLDPRLLELALTAPPRCFLDQGWDRIGFRLATERFLPAEVAWNPTKSEPALLVTRPIARLRDSPPTSEPGELGDLALTLDRARRAAAHA